MAVLAQVDHVRCHRNPKLSRRSPYYLWFLLCFRILFEVYKSQPSLFRCRWVFVLSNFFCGHLKIYGGCITSCYRRPSSNSNPLYGPTLRKHLLLGEHVLRLDFAPMAAGEENVCCYSLIHFCLKHSIVPRPFSVDTTLLNCPLIYIYYNLLHL